MSQTALSETPDVDIDIHTTVHPMQEQMQQLQALMQQQQHILQQQQARIQQLEASIGEQDGEAVNKNAKVTTTKISQELLDVYPAIGETNFFNSELPKNHKVFNWSNYHYTEGMVYKPPPVLQHSEVTLTGAVKRHERDLITIQQYLAHSTRLLDTFAHEIVKSGEANSTFGKRTLKFLNIVRISTSHDASRISRMREKIYLDELGIEHSTTD